MFRSSSYRPQRSRGSHSITEEQEQETPFFGKDAKSPDVQQGNAPFFQARLNVGKPDDEYEREADTVADKVVQRKNTGPVVQQKEISSVQRLASSKEEEKLGTNEERMRRDKEIQTKPDLQQKCAACEKEEQEGAVQKKENNGHPTTASSSLSSQISSSAGKGHALSGETLDEMQSSFGTDFSQVNIHTGSDAAQMNDELGAQAFTHGRDIYFNSGKYNPGTSEGRHLLAHELTHVVQQGAGGEKVQHKMGDGHDLQSPQLRGDMRLEEAYDGNNVMFLRNGSQGEAVTRVQTFLVGAGYSLEQYGIDGIFGSETYRAVVAFQGDNSLEYVDGIVGPETLGAMDTHANYCPLVPAGESCEAPTVQAQKKPECKSPSKNCPKTPPPKGDKKDKPPKPKTPKKSNKIRKGRLSTLGLDEINPEQGTHISHIDVSIVSNGYSKVELTWANVDKAPVLLNLLPGFSVLPGFENLFPLLSRGISSTFKAAPGAGKCGVECEKKGDSVAPDSYCTPHGDFKVQGFADHLSSDRKAANVTWFFQDRGVAFHYYDVPNYPASHGCVRMDRSENGAEWIQHNSIKDVTTITVKHDGKAGEYCWKGKKLVKKGDISDRDYKFLRCEFANKRWTEEIKKEKDGKQDDSQRKYWPEEYARAANGLNDADIDRLFKKHGIKGDKKTELHDAAVRADRVGKDSNIAKRTQ